MKRVLVSNRVAVSAILFLLTFAYASPAADAPDITRSYRFLPRLSHLLVTEGFAGNYREEFFPFGTFNIVTGFDEAEGNADRPAIEPHAEFKDVRSWLVPNSPLDFVWSTDATLNLSGLEGTFEPGQRNRLFFRGLDGQGEPFRLMTVQRGRLLHLIGENDPGCCDFFKFRFDAFAAQTPYSDFNLDGVVDRGDAHLLLANIGMLAGATFEQGDADGDGDVDGDDFLSWQGEVGVATPLGAFAGDSLNDAAFGSAVVPEPATLILSITAAMLLVSWCMRRTRLPIA